MKIVKKPWGEECWICLNTHYCFKRITLNAGHRTSLQYHERKIETNFIAEGRAEVSLQDEDGTLNTTVMAAGDSFSVDPNRIHRVTAITDVVMFEVSTPDVDDVVRLADDTARPNGRIDTEHSR